LDGGGQDERLGLQSLAKNQKFGYACPMNNPSLPQAASCANGFNGSFAGTEAGEKKFQENPA
jgi:hypothetical protein